MINIAGAFCKSKILRILILENRKIDLSVYDGVNCHPWNGGRINSPNPFDRKVFDFYNKNNVGVFLTFSNGIIDDVNDKEGNELLNILNSNKINGVILRNEKLRQHIREKYPNLILTFSITGHRNDITVDDELINQMKDLEQKYDLIVPRFEWTLNPNFYSKVSTEKYKIMVNDTCAAGCDIFEEHFAASDDLNRRYGNPYEYFEKDFLKKVHRCWLPNFNPTKGSKKDKEEYGNCLGMDMTLLQIKMAKSKGYKNWKIMGRENPDDIFIEETKNYLNRILGIPD